MFQAQELVKAHLYQSEEAVIQDAMRCLLQARPDLRILLAVHRYRTEDISLAKAAALAGVSWMQMKSILLEKGVSLRLGAETLEEAKAEIQALRRELDDA
ncbi:MAG: UPF0175 family protein [Gammaproteobacteria bacterium]|nr:UPF0175 family protein [Gammaproteobacteria bacterium]